MRRNGTFFASCALLVVRVASQTVTSNVTTCTPLYQWSINSLNQTPCLVAAFLESVCQGGFAEVNSIPVGTHYIGPSASDASLCQCSTVTYSLVSACGGCQNRTFISWADWAVNCTDVEVAQFLQTVPTEVVVPEWAYLDVTKSNNTFNPILANFSLSNPGSSLSSSSSSSTSPPSSSSVSPTSTFVSLPSSSPTPHKSKSNAGAIAGGVVGGLVVVVAATLALVLYLRRRSHTADDSEHYPSNFSTSGPSILDQDSRHTAASPLSITPYNYEPFAKDMSEAGHTYPGSPIASASVAHTTYDTPASPAIEVLHRYTGLAEI
ncbi:hypothetical protein C8R45DRAFT_617223 [Mycena sanguinolenta]|nr:hypothetical protein C8R45DRAFT_617223 [Mycena sanguinolenta]